MATNHYFSKSESLDVYEFGSRLLNTGDIDPVYVALYNHSMGAPQFERWVLAYILFYDVGLACYLCEFEGADFWHWVGVAAANKEPAPTGGRWPRSPERRHFRGIAAVDCVAKLKGKYWHAPEDFCRSLCSGSEVYTGMTFSEFAARVKGHYLFGDWAAFKLADLLERTNDVNINFSEAEVFMYSEPRKSALLLYELAGLDPSRSDEQKIEHVVVEINTVLGSRPAPPRHERGINIQEIETILCKWKSHYKGHYWVGKDIEEILKSSTLWSPYSRVAREFECHIPDEVEYSAS